MSPLRLLAKDYAEKKLDRKQYLQKRDALLDALEQGNPLPTAGSPQPSSFWDIKSSKNTVWLIVSLLVLLASLAALALRMMS